MIKKWHQNMLYVLAGKSGGYNHALMPFISINKRGQNLPSSRNPASDSQIQVFACGYFSNAKDWLNLDSGCCNAGLTSSCGFLLHGLPLDSFLASNRKLYSSDTDQTQ